MQRTAAAHAQLPFGALDDSARSRHYALMTMEGERPDCPWLCLVCGLDHRDFDDAPWGLTGEDPSYAHCFCCGVEFGYGDASIAGIRSWRDRWLTDARWVDETKRPDGWSLPVQLQAFPERVR